MSPYQNLGFLKIWASGFSLWIPPNCSLPSSGDQKAIAKPFRHDTLAPHVRGFSSRNPFGNLEPESAAESELGFRLVVKGRSASLFALIPIALHRLRYSVAAMSGSFNLNLFNQAPSTKLSRGFCNSECAELQPKGWQGISCQVSLRRPFRGSHRY